VLIRDVTLPTAGVGSRADFRADDRADVRVDVRVDGHRITDIGPELARAPAEEEVPGRGGALLPGLVDHHLHLHALAAAEGSVRCGPPAVTDAAGLAAELAAAPADRHGWVRGLGYAESVAGLLDAAALDRLHSTRPVRVQHRSGALWIVNTAAARALDLDSGQHPGIERGPDGTPTGRLWRADDWLRSRLPPAAPPDLAAVGARLAALGVTAVTDATPDLDDSALTALRTAVEAGALPQHVHLLGVPLGREVQGPRLSTGPYKLVLADSELPQFPELVDRVRAAHAAGRAVAAHCVTREALVLLLAALDEAGHRPGDRVEHGAVIPGELLAELAGRGIPVVTQPGFIADRGDDYLRDVEPADLPDLYRCASLQAAGVPLALSSDAPYGPLDPWTVLRAAIHRRTRTGAVVGEPERLSPAAALDGLLAAPQTPGGPPRRIAPGAAADLVLLDAPLAEALTGSGIRPQLVLVGGRPIGNRP